MSIDVVDWKREVVWWWESFVRRVHAVVVVLAVIVAVLDGRSLTRCCGQPGSQ